MKRSELRSDATAEGLYNGSDERGPRRGPRRTEEQLLRQPSLDYSLNLKILKHPQVLVVVRVPYGDVTAVWRRYAPNRGAGWIHLELRR